METSSFSPTPPTTQAEFEALINEMRPQLHHYVTRMIGSVIDAEDVVQETLTKAYNSLGLLTPQSNLRGWLFRIAHNKAIDHLRHNHQQSMERLDEYSLVVEDDSPLEEKELVAMALSVFLKLAPRQRSCVILKDVLGYSLVEISELLDATVPEVKAALHRGRTKLRELGENLEEDGPGLTLNSQERERLSRYVEHFNARDFEAVRAMLAEEVQLELIAQTTKRGVSAVNQGYFANYNQVNDWRFTLGLVEGRAAILVHDPQEGSGQPAYFILIKWENNQVALIRDYRYARYVMQEAEVRVV